MERRCRRSAGQWAVWTSKAVELLGDCRRLAAVARPVPAELLRLANELTDVNAAVFDVANNFAGCIPGIHEICADKACSKGRSVSIQ